MFRKNNEYTFILIIFLFLSINILNYDNIALGSGGDDDNNGNNKNDDSNDNDDRKIKKIRMMIKMMTHLYFLYHFLRFHNSKKSNIEILITIY